MIRLLVSIIVSLMLASPALAATYWVSPTGAASWGSCTGASPLSGSSACSLATAEANADDDDIVYLRDGTYSVTGANAHGLQPTNSGSAGHVITFSAYTGETPIITGDAASNQYGLYISGKSYIKVHGVSFLDLKQPIIITNGDYNELSYCTVSHSSETSVASYAYVGLYITGGSTHNWVHHSTFHSIGQYGCNEGGDIIKIGGSDSVNGNDYNTIESNTIYNAGHTLTDDWGSYNVWRNNVGYNAGWKVSTFNVTGTATGGSTTTLIDTTTNFVTAGVGVGWHIYDYGEIGKRATVTSISTTTNTNDTLNFTQGYIPPDGYTPTFANGNAYSVSECEIVPDPSGTIPGDAKYGHRNFSFTGYETGVTARYNLFEGNRSGYASTNPNNGGSDGLTLGSPGNIIRYNYFFGSDGPAINLKSYGDTGHSGYGNRIYHNTMYANGKSQSVWLSSPNWRVAIFQYNATYSISNVFTDNLINSNGVNPFTVGEYDYKGDVGDQTWNNNWCTGSTETVCATSGDPLFSNPDITTPSSSATLPNLSLQSSSNAIDQGTYLTQASGSGSNTETLIVDDALYFQDGTLGSSLASHQPDWIAIGTVDNIVQISSINYATNTITLASAKTWADNANIWLYKKSDGIVVLYGSAPDQGAYEFQAATRGHSNLSGSNLIIR